MAWAQRALALFSILLGGCTSVGVVKLPWAEAARRCYQSVADREIPIYHAVYSQTYQGLRFPGRVWMIGRAACDAFVDEMLAKESQPGIAVVPPPPPSSRSGVEPFPLPLPSPRSGDELTPLPPPDARPAPRDFTAVPDLRTIYFDFDQSVIRPNARDALETTAQWLKANERVLLLIEGHCDERGTDEYNLALGERRALAARDYLIGRGVTADRITTISYGEERPVCTERNEECWQRNRRAEFRRRPDRE
jgi:peptidoglycan-associated lipoprotein